MHANCPLAIQLLYIQQAVQMPNIVTIVNCVPILTQAHYSVGVHDLYPPPPSYREVKNFAHLAKLNTGSQQSTNISRTI